jgi:hypothetical protein
MLVAAGSRLLPCLDWRIIKAVEHPPDVSDAETGTADYSKPRPLDLVGDGFDQRSIAMASPPPLDQVYSKAPGMTPVNTQTVVKDHWSSGVVAIGMLIYLIGVPSLIGLAISSGSSASLTALAAIGAIPVAGSVMFFGFVANLRHYGLPWGYALLSFLFPIGPIVISFITVPKRREAAAKREAMTIYPRYVDEKEIAELPPN